MTKRQSYSRDSVLIRLDLAFAAYQSSVEDAALEVFGFLLKPKLDELGLEFVSGNGDYWLMEDGDIIERWLPGGEDYHAELLGQRLSDLLNLSLPGMPNTCLACFMPCYNPEGDDNS